MKNTDTIQRLIKKTTEGILDKWTAEALLAGRDADDYIADQLDILEETEPEVCTTVAQAHLERMFAK